jgi:acetyltransferase EpsM
MYIFGASGHGKVIYSILKSQNKSINGFIDDDVLKNNFKNIKVYRKKELSSNISLIIAIGNNKIRKKISLLFFNFINIISENTIIDSSLKIGKGCLICDNATVNIDTIIGDHVIINTSAVIDHDCFLDDFVHISPNAAIAGGSQIGEGSHIGIGAVVIQGIKIGKWCKIGAGAVVINDIPDYCTAVGVPAKIIKFNNND